MNDNSVITICDYHNTDGEIEKSELTTTARMSGIPEDYYILYDEQSDELKGCLTTIHVTNGNCIDISRKGRYTTDLKIERGKRNICFYSTPFGQLSMGVYASRIQSEFTEGIGVKLDFSYTLDFNNSLVSKSRLKINAKYKEVR